MCKNFIYVFVLLFAISFSFMSCEKRNPVETYCEHWAQEISNVQKTGTLYAISTLCGHSYSACGGNCMPAPYGHVDCQGAGNSCTMSATLSVVSVGVNQFTGTTQDSTDLTGEEFFNMPDRSLYLGLDGGKPLWLNIPAQLSIRDSVTRVFTFNGLYFTDHQVYKNQ